MGERRKCSRPSPERDRRIKAALRRHPVDGVISRLEELLRLDEALADDPLPRCCPDLISKLPREGSFAITHAPCQGCHTEGLVETLLHPVEQFTHCRRVCVWR